MILEASGHIFEKYSNVNFYENLSSRSRVVPCGLSKRRTDGWADMAKLIVAFRDFANVLNKNSLERQAGAYRSSRKSHSTFFKRGKIENI
jgi:hypothetical protein